MALLVRWWPLATSASPTFAPHGDKAGLPLQKLQQTRWEALATLKDEEGAATPRRRRAARSSSGWLPGLLLLLLHHHQQGSPPCDRRTLHTHGRHPPRAHRCCMLECQHWLHHALLGAPVQRMCAVRGLLPAFSCLGHPAPPQQVQAGALSAWPSPFRFDAHEHSQQITPPPCAAYTTQRGSCLVAACTPAGPAGKGAALQIAEHFARQTDCALAHAPALFGLRGTTPPCLR